MRGSILIEELDAINHDLTVRIQKEADTLQEADKNIKSGYWITVDYTDKMLIFADNGFDVTPSIEVDEKTKSDILSLCKDKWID